MTRLVDTPPDRRWSLLAYGDPNIDLVFEVERAPCADQKVLGRRMRPYAGGTVANAACAASAFGCPTLAYGRVGDDGDGAFLRAEYARSGVDTQWVRTQRACASAAAMIMIEASGEKALVYSPMAGPLLDAPSLADALANCQLLYAMPYDLAEFEHVHRLARAAGVALAIDIEAVMVPDPDHLHTLLALADIVFMNDSTYRSILGEAPRLENLAPLLRHGPNVVVVSCGAQGALAVTAGDACAQSAFPAAVVDSTGAGDCFNGTFLAALLEGRDLRASLRLACAAGSFAVRQQGARSGFATRPAIEALP